jgi:hypothetical protein
MQECAYRDSMMVRPIVPRSIHFFPQSANPTASRALVSWFKRWLNQDARFTPFTCGFTGSAVSNFRSNAC